MKGSSAAKAVGAKYKMSITLIFASVLDKAILIIFD